jgi:hypothetical protein
VAARKREAFRDLYAQAREDQLERGDRAIVSRSPGPRPSARDQEARGKAKGSPRGPERYRSRGEHEGVVEQARRVGRGGCCIEARCGR